MEVTKGTWRMCAQIVPGSFSSSPTREPGNEAKYKLIVQIVHGDEAASKHNFLDTESCALAQLNLN